MVRLNADFPNVTYVLAFDRLVVERNLDEENGVRGRDYLEKIIQVSFDIPEPEPETIHRILFAEMDVVLESLKTRPLDQHRWGNVFHSGFKEHFRTIRHIKRYANGLRLTLAPLAEEVDLVDFLAIELIRVFHPEVYLGIVQGKDMLAPNRLGFRDGVPAERLSEWTEALCAKASLSEPKSEESEGRLITDHDRWAGLRDAAVVRIHAANENGELWKLDNLPYVLFRWLEWTTEDEVRIAVTTHVTEDDKLVAFVGHFVSESHSHTMGDKVSRVHRKISKQGLEALLDMDAATTRLKEVSSGGSEGAAAAHELLSLIKAKDEPWDR